MDRASASWLGGDSAGSSSVSRKGEFCGLSEIALFMLMPRSGGLVGCPAFKGRDDNPNKHP